MRKPGRKREPEVFSVSDVARPYSEEIDDRRRRYLFWMAVRTACFILAIVLVLVLHGTARVVAFALVAVPAVVLPLFTVVFANAGREPSGYRFATYDPQAQAEGRTELDRLPDEDRPPGGPADGSAVPGRGSGDADPTR